MRVCVSTCVCADIQTFARLCAAERAAAERIADLLAEGDKNLAMLHRQAVIQQLYVRDRIVVEEQAPKPNIK